jgi:hypothetical protein
VTPLLKVADLGSRSRQYTPGRDALRSDFEEQLAPFDERAGHYLLLLHTEE